MIFRKEGNGGTKIKLCERVRLNMCWRVNESESERESKLCIKTVMYTLYLDGVENFVFE